MLKNKLNLQRQQQNSAGTRMQPLQSHQPFSQARQTSMFTKSPTAINPNQFSTRLPHLQSFTQLPQTHPPHHHVHTQDTRRPQGLCNSIGSQFNLTKANLIIPPMTLPQCSGISSEDGKNMFVLQSNGNLVLYDKSHFKPLWQSASANKGTAPYALKYTADGLLTVTDTTGANIWQNTPYPMTTFTPSSSSPSSFTSPSPNPFPGGVRLSVHNDRVNIRNNGQLIWTAG